MERAATPPDHAGVTVPPPLIFLAGLLAGVGLEAIEPIDGIDSPWRWIALVLGVAAWVYLDGSAMRRFQKADTALPPFRPTSAIVTTGPYGFSRNPIYIGMACLYAGLALALDAIWALILLPGVLLIIRFYVIAREERYLEAKFGEEYLAYKRRVRRWL
jgi:protein-S-isoprenylcysteine O-methyltransferase Ste14